MFDVLKQILQKHQTIAAYLFFGICTTAINFAVYLICHNMFFMSATMSNVLAWFISVLFAFMTNKLFVFNNHDWQFRTIMTEFFKFLYCRIGSGLFETLTLWGTVDRMQYNGNAMKIIVGVFVVIMNYISSKMLVFKNNGV